MGVDFNNYSRGMGHAREVCPIAEAKKSGSFNSGNDTVKHFLKSKILERRKKSGLENIEVDFAPKTPYPMTEEEKEKDRKRKQSNRKSAQRCRQKQKEEYENNKQILARLKEDYENLLDKVKETEDERNRVLFSLRKILPEMYIQEALRQINYSFNQNTDMRSQSGLVEMSPESSEAVDNLILDDGSDLSETLNIEDNSEEGEIYFATLFNSSEEDGSLAGHVESLTTGNDVSLQIFDNSYVSRLNTAPREHLSEHSNVLSSSLILLDGSTMYS